MISDPSKPIGWLPLVDIIKLNANVAHSDQKKPDNTVTTISELHFTATLYENGVNIRCEAINAVMQAKDEKPLKSSKTLEVLSPEWIARTPCADMCPMRGLVEILSKTADCEFGWC
ncbi:CSON005257 protein [Gryllus bimaculatus]|nr:CSON005257 protein [Gryllus bimaculatus]